MARLPSFLIIGAMKSATSTLYEQMSRQPGIFMPSLKEPNFFSNDEQFARGIKWYQGLFEKAAHSDIVGEASTHYTKLPTYPRTVERMQKALDAPRLIYVMRDPIDRLISQYIHEWSQGEIHTDLASALQARPELVAYSNYAQQLQPFIEAFGRSSILPVFFDRMIVDPRGELQRICAFIGYNGSVRWHDDLSRRNASAERVRKFPLYDLLVEHPVAARLRRTLVPKNLRTKIRASLSMAKRPVLPDAIRKQLQRVFDEDLAVLGGWLGVTLNSENFREVTAIQSLNWHRNDERASQHA